MKIRTVEVREGENMGPVDWSHPTAKDMSGIWREVEKQPEGFLFNGRQIVSICMYDGWPYWTPTPAVCFIGPMNSSEWNFFNSYGVNSRSITRRTVAQGGSAACR